MAGWILGSGFILVGIFLLLVGRRIADATNALNRRFAPRSVTMPARRMPAVGGIMVTIGVLICIATHLSR